MRNSLQTVVAFSAMLTGTGCGTSGGHAAAATGSTGGASSVVDGSPGTGGADASTAPPLATILADFIAAWRETDASKRRADLDASCRDDVVYVDPAEQATSIAPFSDMIAGLQKVPAYRVVLTSGPDAHHSRVRYSWIAKTDQDAALVSGMDYVTLAADGRFQRIIGFNDPFPTSFTLDAPMKALVDALSDPDGATRLASINAALATGAIFIDPAQGELDASGLSANIGAWLAANPGAKTTIDAFQEYAGGFRAPWTTTAGTPNHGMFVGTRDGAGHVTEITKFDGDLPPIP